MKKKIEPQNAPQGPSEAERDAKWRELYDAALMQPLKWVQHDVTAHDDPQLCELRDVNGMEAMGRWWILVEAIAASRGHAIDVGTPAKWARLAARLEYYGDNAVERCQEFVGELYGLDLINAEAFDGFHRIRSRRIDRTAEQAATDAANGGIGAWVREYSRHGG